MGEWGDSSFKLSTFTDLFQTYFTIIDPEERAAAGECFIADCDIERKDINGIVRYLKSKYGLDTVTIYQFVLFNYPINENPV